jgi:cell division protein FtsL
MRLLNILVIGLLILAASVVYKIKFDSTLQAERVGKLAGEIRREQNAIANLRAEWSRLDTPGRIQGLADRHLALKPIVPTQIDNLDRLPDKPPALVPPTGEPLSVQNAPAVPDATGSVTPKNPPLGGR